MEPAPGYCNRCFKPKCRQILLKQGHASVCLQIQISAASRTFLLICLVIILCLLLAVDRSDPKQHNGTATLMQDLSQRRSKHSLPAVRASLQLPALCPCLAKLRHLPCPHQRNGSRLLDIKCSADRTACL